MPGDDELSTEPPTIDDQVRGLLDIVGARARNCEGRRRIQEERERERERELTR